MQSNEYQILRNHKEHQILKETPTDKTYYQLPKNTSDYNTHTDKKYYQTKIHDIDNQKIRHTSYYETPTNYFDKITPREAPDNLTMRDNSNYQTTKYTNDYQLPTDINKFPYIQYISNNTIPSTTYRFLNPSQYYHFANIQTNDYDNHHIIRYNKDLQPHRKTKDNNIGLEHTKTNDNPTPSQTNDYPAPRQTNDYPAPPQTNDPLTRTQVINHPRKREISNQELIIVKPRDYLTRMG